MAFSLEHVVPWGRSFDEYVSMFSLTPDMLRKKILGCGDGPASFNSRMNQAGQAIVSLDPIYQFTGHEIESRISTTYQVVLEQLEKNQNDYLWDTIRSPAELGQVRMTAMREFLTDYTQGKADGRYIAGELPLLPFEDDQFEMALCSHLLFLYSEQLSLDFHKKAVTELSRVAQEIRIFPLVTLAGKKSPYVTEIEVYLKHKGHDVRIEPVEYEFQRGGNEMMKIQKRT